jgi:hypothetical protein
MNSLQIEVSGRPLTLFGDVMIDLKIVAERPTAFTAQAIL